MNDAEPASTIDPEAPTPPAYAPPPVPAYLAEQQGAPVRTAPSFRDRVVGIRAVIAVALASLVLGGAGGAVLGASTNGGNDGFGGRGPGGFPGGQRGTFPGQGQQFQGPANGLPGSGNGGPAQ
jgi:hypothetical protein